MKKENSDIQISHIGLIKIFSNIDTQSAIVAAIVISFVTFLFAGFINLCNYIYWYSYFEEFKIPMAYFGEAIIHEEGIKYTAVLYIPLIISFWWIFNLIKKGLRHSGLKFNKGMRLARNKILNVVLFLIFGFLSFYGLTECIKFGNLFLTLIFIEFVIFIMWNLCKSSFGKKFSFSVKTYYTIRIISAVLLIYMLLGYVYYAGSFDNYSRNASQLLRIVSEKESEKEDGIAQLVLLETADYYYVTDVKAENNNLKILNNDSYRFISKVDCPIKSTYGNLSYIRGRTDDNRIIESFGYFFVMSIILVFLFVALLGIPLRKESVERGN